MKEGFRRHFGGTCKPNRCEACIGTAEGTEVTEGHEEMADFDYARRTSMGKRGQLREAVGLSWLRNGVWERGAVDAGGITSVETSLTSLHFHLEFNGLLGRIGRLFAA
jgi:hypothetical protein